MSLKIKLFYYSLGFAAVFIFSLFLPITQQADDIIQKVSVKNAPPAVENIFIFQDAFNISHSGLYLIESVVTPVRIFGTVEDVNGCKDVSDSALWNIKAYREDVFSGIDCTEDEENCYRVPPESIELKGCKGPSDIDVEYSAVLPLQYFLDPTDAGSPFEKTQWKIAVIPKDQSGAAGIGNDFFETRSLMALEARFFTEKDIHFSLSNSGNRTIQIDSSFQCSGEYLLGEKIFKNAAQIVLARFNPFKTNEAKIILRLEDEKNDALQCLNMTFHVNNGEAL